MASAEATAHDVTAVEELALLARLELSAPVDSSRDQGARTAASSSSPLRIDVSQQQAAITLVSPSSHNLRRAQTLPTLLEELTEDVVSDEQPEISADDTADLHQVDDLDVAGLDVKTGHDTDGDSDNDDPDQSKSKAKATRDDDEDNSDDEQDQAFAELLLHLPYDPSFLTLSISDITRRKLRKVSNALAASEALRPYARADGTQRQVQTDMPLYLSKMRVVRTILAVETLQMLLERHEEEDVLLALTDAIRKIFERHAVEHGMEPLAHAPVVITSSNVCGAVLAARETLSVGGGRVERSALSPTSMHRQQHQARSPVKSTAVEYASVVPASAVRSTASAVFGRRNSTSSISSVSSASMQQQQRPTTPNQPSSSSGVKTKTTATRGGMLSPSKSKSSNTVDGDRRSILRREGMQVLMQEKIATFRHRPGADDIPQFKVRNASGAATAQAAERRARSLAYGNEQSKALQRSMS
ncbi:TPA: hypothetical protein N0F65_001023 [Lagenidium giganteum]|uniref:F-box domain-containing protein n=1 Tax=Lagenidium giganteum TaxID=4803 RepID=A0AAV2YYT6_9STRA|nr:TPA: hypothetical protein N0F65_001023 [Lagenidium giganteum]